jgi:hypothetical protein
MPKKKKKPDIESVRQVLMEVGGNFTEASKVFKDAGYEYDEQNIRALVKGDSILKHVFDADAPTAESTLVRVKPAAEDKNPAQLAESQKRQADYLSLKMLRDSGASENRIKRFMNLSDFIGWGFKRAVDYSYGVQMESLEELVERGKEIRAKLRDGASYKNSKGVSIPYTEEQKMEWQKEWTTIMALVDKYSQSTNNAALIRVKALMIEGGNKGGGGTSKKLKPQPVSEAA